ncbi:fungal Zn binuclear cluster domain-containing protein [Dactylonectria estremocensis]|uniref:Fungal Zn binuclear cluster domain-containing protein n=1 Tax=Dactylonectria estremocensis TaxID=1079267 RepID=A0A9P9EE88_9HYPO|nr:fungal Zn binuclear cluster domain-containing protein [Dactylonectria estremocensis]
MGTIRHHTKSRRGCVNCKVRRVKCDEAKPACAACVRRDDECTYVSRIKQVSGAETDGSSRASPNLGGASSELIYDTHKEVPRCFDYSGKNMMQLRLMHHYGTVTVGTFAEAFEIQGRILHGLQVDIPLLAFEHPFLLDTVLLVAMIHMASIDNRSVNTLDVAKYRNQAICAIRRELTNISDKNTRAIRASSLLLAATSFAADRVTEYSGIWLTNFLALNIGSRTFMPPRGASGPAADHGHRLNVAVATRPFGDPEAPPSIPLRLEEALHMDCDDFDWEYRDDLNRAASGIGMLFESIHQPSTMSSIVFKLKSWPFLYVSEGFVQLAREERPRALIVMAYYLALLRYFPDIWLYENVAREDLQKITKILGPEWHEFLSIPTTAVQMEDQSLLTEYLISQVPKPLHEDMAVADMWPDSFLLNTSP